MAESSPLGRVLVVGDVMTDIIVRPEGPPVRGSDRRATIRRRQGGSAANQAVWLGAMGARVALVARVGVEDVATLEAYLRARSVNPLLIADTERPTGALVTLVDPDGERSFLTDRGANLALSPADLPDHLLETAALLVLSGYSFFEPAPRAAVMALAAGAAARGVPIAVDPASTAFLEEVGPDNFLAWTRGTEILFANAEEAHALSGTDDLDTQMRQLGEIYPRVVVKRGALGAAIGGRDGLRLSLPAPQVEVVDTTGAGDAFAAAFIAAERAGLGEAEAMSRAIAAGSEAVRRLGGQPQA